MTKLLVEPAMILTLDCDERLIERGHIVIEHGVIVAIGSGAYAGDVDRRIDASGLIATPGLVNAHTHSQSSTMAGFGDRLSHPAFMWLTQAHTARRTPAEAALAVKLCAWAMLTSGTTACIDHFPGQRCDFDDLHAVRDAWAESGVRATLALRFFDDSFADIAPPGITLPDDADRLLGPMALCDVRALAEAFASRPHRVPVWPAPSNPERCTQDALLWCAEHAARFDTGIHIHLAETAAQLRLAQERHGDSTVAHLHRIGALSDRWSCAHSVWLDDADIALMADSDALVVLNPESNARIGAGVAPIAKLRAAGVRLALGTDGAGANDNMSMQEAMRTAATLDRSGPRAGWVGSREALGWATTGGADAVRVPRLGRLAVGAPADLVLYRLDSPHWAPLNDPVAQMVFAETGASVDTVIVGGEVLLRGGRPTRFDPVELAAEARAMAARLRVRNADLFLLAERVAEVLP